VFGELKSSAVCRALRWETRSPYSFFQDSAGQLKVGTEFIAASPSAGVTVVESLNVAVIVCC